MNNMDFLASVCMITYNHEKYITKAIDSVLMQNTNFNYEIVIGEDSSTDCTRQILLEYKSKYPKKIKLVLQERNAGIVQNIIDTFKFCKGKYIAFLEGDDYWTNPFKLQKQVEFLDENPDYGLVYTDISFIDNKNKIISNTHFEQRKFNNNSGYVFEKLLVENFINSLTVCVRSDILFDYFANFPNEWFLYDYRIWLHIASQSKIYFLNEKTASYRIHENGISNSKGFFDKRNPLTKQSALIYNYTKNGWNNLDRRKAAQVIYYIIRNRNLTFKEKKPSILFLFFKQPLLIFSIVIIILKKFGRS